MKIKDFINHLSANGKRCFTTSEIKENLGVSDKAVWNAIERLKAVGELASPAKGFYLIIPPEYRILKCLPPEFFIPQLMTYWKMKYYVCLQSAAMYYGATHQQTQIFYVMVSKNRPMIRCGKVRIEFIAKKQLLSTPVQVIKTPAGYINVSTPESTAMDIICYVRKCGGLNSVLTILEELAERIGKEPLRILADTSHEKYWIQRLGFLLEELGYLELSETLYENLKHYSTNIIPLAPYLSMKGSKRNLKWRIAVNTHLESDL
jgi:predicted transcriptional regulator of viral defense system